MSDKIRVGIVGSGGRSSAHAKAYLDFGAEIVAFCDIVKESVKTRAEEYGWNGEKALSISPSDEMYISTERRISG